MDLGAHGALTMKDGFNILKSGPLVFLTIRQRAMTAACTLLDRTYLLSRMSLLHGSFHPQPRCRSRLTDRSHNRDVFPSSLSASFHVVNSARSIHRPGRQFAAVLVLCAGMCCAQAETIESRVATGRAHLDSRNFTELHKLLNATDDLPGVWGEADSNGYDWAFYSHFLRAEALAGQTNPVDALDEYRFALWQPTEAVITNRPIPYAKALYGLAKQFMKLTRWADAEDTLASVLRLADNNRVKADHHWCKATRCFLVGDAEEMGRQADAVIEAAPERNWKAYHFAALAQYTYGRQRQAAQRWLAGLNAFSHCAPISDVEKYLNTAMCYWKVFSQSDIREYYDTLTHILLANPLSAENGRTITRLLFERIKLERLFPNLLAGEGPEEIMTSALALGNVREAAGDRWVPRTNCTFGIYADLLQTGHWERIVNQALQAESKGNHTHARGLYERVLSRTGDVRMCADRVQGYNPLFFAGSRRARLELNNTIRAGERYSKQRTIRLCDFLIDMVLSNTAGRGVYDCTEELFQVLLYRARVNLKVGDAQTALASWHWACELYPQSVWRYNDVDLTRCRDELESGDTTEAEELVSRLLREPRMRPSVELWERALKVYRTLASYGTSKERRELTRRAIDVCLSGLEKGVFDFKAERGDPARYRLLRLSFNPLFKQLMDFGDVGQLDEGDYRRLQLWLGRFGVTIPAQREYALAIRDALSWQRRFSVIDRAYPIQFTVNCDARPWRAKEGVCVFFDFLPKPVELSRDRDRGMDIWSATVEVPPRKFLIMLNCYKSVKEAAKVLPANALDKGFLRFCLRDDGTSNMSVNVTVERDYPVILVFQYDACRESTPEAVVLCVQFPDARDPFRREFHMYDDGTHGDDRPQDGMWSLALVAPAEASRVEYMFQAVGVEGLSAASMAARKRGVFLIPVDSPDTNIILNTHGEDVQ